MSNILNNMKKQPLSKEFAKMQKLAGIVNENLTPEETLFWELRDEYWEGDNLKGLVKDERFLSLPKDMQTRLHTIVFNNMRQNFY